MKFLNSSDLIPNNFQMVPKYCGYVHRESGTVHFNSWIPEMKNASLRNAVGRKVNLQMTGINLLPKRCKLTK